MLRRKLKDMTKNNALLVFAVLSSTIFLEGCLKQEKTTSASDTNSTKDSASWDSKVEERIKEMGGDSMFTVDSRSECDAGTKQVLNVKEFVVYPQNTYFSNTKSVKSVRNIKLIGNPGKGSCTALRVAYLKFDPHVNATEAPKFYYVEKPGAQPYAEIRLFYPPQYFDAVLQQLRQAKNISCWYATYKDTAGKNTQQHGELFTD